MAASHYGLDNLIAVVDYNKVMAKGSVADQMSIARSDSLSEIRILGMGQAACFKLSLVSWKAQSSQGHRATRSARSTVAPHQIRRPGGASR